MRAGGEPFRSRRRLKPDGRMAAQQDTALIAGQLADLTRTVEWLAGQLKTLSRAG